MQLFLETIIAYLESCIAHRIAQHRASHGRESGIIEMFATIWPLMAQLLQWHGG